VSCQPWRAAAHEPAVHPIPPAEPTGLACTGMCDLGVVPALDRATGPM
jgi:hypothetical protein